MKRISAVFVFLLIVITALTACDASLWFVSDPGKNKEETTKALQTSSGSDTQSFSTDSSTSGSDTTGMDTTSDTRTTAPGNTDTGIASGTSTLQTKSSASSTTKTPSTSAPKPDTEKEMRAVWVSYIELNSMIGNKTEDQAKAAIDGIMTNAKAYGLNSVIFHARANSDAYYKSSVFNPATKVKSLLSAGFDPLAYAIQAAHNRGLELHAWVNPYRIGTDKSFAKCNDYFKSGDKYYYNPASINAQKLIISGVEEITRKYDVDGVQFDDYFYPTDLSQLSNSDFDSYKSKGGTISIGDWRRAKVSALIASVYAKVHSSRSGCVFGVSPRGVQSQNYSTVYADVGLWMKVKGYIDYICPQVYFGLLHNSQPFKQNVDSWIAMPRNKSVKLYIGLALHKIGILSDEYAGTDAGKTEWAKHNDRMKQSLLYVRSKPECSGVMFFSYQFFKPSLLTKSNWSKEVAIREVENLLAVMKP